MKNCNMRKFLSSTYVRTVSDTEKNVLQFV